MNENIYAHTAPGDSYPEYISVNKIDDGAGVEITVRSPASLDGACGSVAAIRLTAEQAKEMAMAFFVDPSAPVTPQAA